MLAASIAAGNCPHSLIIQGAAGMGRRELALWLAAELCGGPVYRAAADGEGYEPAHPDFLGLVPAVDSQGKEKKSIGVDQVRDELIPFISLTSHGSGARVAVIFPADALTLSAANSLLKTLEEPPVGSVIVLITETLAKLPATIISRCQRVRLAPPAAEQSLEWLARQVPGCDFKRLLEFAGGAPLAAVQLHEAGFDEFATTFLGNLDRLEQGGLSPVVAAAACKGREGLALQLLEWSLAERLRGEAEGSRGVSAMTAAGHRQLGQIRELRRVLNGGINAELGLAGLLLNWYGGFGRRQEDRQHG